MVAGVRDEDWKGVRTLLGVMKVFYSLMGGAVVLVNKLSQNSMNYML